MNYRDIPWKFSSPNVSYLEFPIDRSGELKLRIEKRLHRGTFNIFDEIRIGIKKKDEFMVLREGCTLLTPIMRFPTYYNERNTDQHIPEYLIRPLMDDMDSALWTAIGVFKGRIPYKEES